MAARLLRPHVAVVVGGHTPACCRPAQVAVASAPYLVHPKLLSVERPSTSPPAPRGAQSSPPGSGGASQPAPCGGDACCQCCQSPLFLRSFDWHQRWH